MVKAGRPMHSLGLFFLLRQGWFIYHSLLNLGNFSFFLLKMEHTSTQINADLAVFFQCLVKTNIMEL